SDNTDAVTLTINKGTVLGTLMEPVVNGIATFSDLSITRADTGYQLTATVSGFPAALSNLFDITPAAAAQLAYLTAPGNVIDGALHLPAVQVAIEDVYGNIETGNSSTQVTLTLSSNRTGAALTGTTNPSTVSGGIVSYSGLSLSKAGNGYKLQAQAPGLPAL